MIGNRQLHLPDPSRLSIRELFRIVSTTCLCIVLPLVLGSCGQATADSETEESDVPTEIHPGAAPYSKEFRDRLQTAVRAKGESYVPRTHHLTADGRALYTNRLILEDSPYLLQHAHNPVDWYAWGPEAFERAKAEDKPIFLSIGYSTCHWCHAMERESFESIEIARILNKHFISIKIDRERRPDVDEFYMTAVQMLTGHGGWPMSSFLTPEAQPFFGGTYYPPQQFTALLERVREGWANQRDQIRQQAVRVADAVKEVIAARGQAAAVGQEAVQRAVGELLARHDSRRGGFGGAPKFPHEPELLFLLERSLRTGDGAALAAAEKSLDAMARGGIYDQVGGGVHRYSTDSEWLVPHFEKMLYNQAHLSRAYLAAYRLTGKPFYARVARQTLDYVLREMTSPEGGFYSATDADSAGVEGEFFVWTAEELREVLPDEEAALAIDLWGVSETGNFEGKSILHLPRSLDAFAADRKLELEDLFERVDRVRDTLWRLRERREHPLRDDKVVTAWNGMMFTSLAEGADILDEDRYLKAAVKVADFLWRTNRRAEGELWRVHLNGSSSVVALQNDYAYLAEAFLALYDSTGDERWLKRAQEVCDAMLDKFWDPDQGGFFMSAAGADPHLIARPKSPNDGAIPSGNSVAVRALALLASRTGEESYGNRASATLSAFAESIQRNPAGFSYMLLGADELLSGGVGPRQYGASGKVRATARLEPAAGALTLEVDLAIREGWHINSHQPLQDHLIATDMSVASDGGTWTLGEVRYPEGETVRLSFQDEPLAVYQGDVRLSGRVTYGGGDAQGPAPVVPLRLKIQACNDRLCLRPEELVLEVPAATAL